MIEFFEPCIPPTTSHHVKKIVKVGKFSRLADTEKLVQAKDFWTALFINHRPAAPLTGPLKLSIRLSWPYRKGEPQKNRRSPIWRDTAPDLSNLTKTIEDRLAALRFFDNDGQVAVLHVEKTWSDSPGIHVRIEAVAT